MIRKADSYPIFYNRKRIDYVLKNLNIPSGTLRYKGDVTVDSSSVNFGTSSVSYLPSDNIVKSGDILAQNDELYVCIGDLRITGTVQLLDNSELRIVDRELEL